MSDFILKNIDIANFIPAFSAAIVTTIPGVLQGSASNVNINGQPVCLEGDEKNTQVPGCMYIQGGFVIPGAGTEKISALAGDQTTQKVKCNGKPLILKGSKFTAEFQVSAPAQQPAPPASPIPDPSPQYSGNGLFVTTNLTVKAS